MDGRGRGAVRAGQGDRAIRRCVLPAGKFLFWTNNVLGDSLWEALHSLVRAGVLEYRDEPDHQFRWSPTAAIDARTTQ